MDIHLTQRQGGSLGLCRKSHDTRYGLDRVDLDEAGQPRKWKVENSWGDKVGTDGYFVASDAWMDEYTYQIVVRKEFLTADELAAYEAEPIVPSTVGSNGSFSKIMI